MTFRERLTPKAHGPIAAATLVSMLIGVPQVFAQENPPATPPSPAPIQPAVAAPTPPPRAAEGAVPLDLEEAIAYAYEHNPQIAGAAAEVRAARARVGQTKAVRQPQLGVNGELFHQGPQLSFGGTANPIVPAVRWSVGVFLSQIIFDWGQRAALQRSAQKEAKAIDLRLGESRNNVRLVVSAAYFNVLRAQRLLSVANDRRASAQEQLRVATERFTNDIAPRFDVIRTEAELANAEQEVIQAQNEIALAEATFNTALGRDVATPVALKPETPELTPPVPFDTARRATLQNRPELRAQEELIEANKDLVRARRAENKPQISLQSNYTQRTATGFNTGQNYAAGLVMTFPFFDSGLTRNRVREAQAQTDVQRAFYERTRQQVELDLKQALLDMEEARRRIDAANKELTSAREALRVAEVRYRAGVGTNVEVTDAQVAVARAGQNVANARFDFLTAQARAENAAGAPVTALR